ncbi:mechanosensitive ion channel family protein [Luteimonas kalidii]|uniref:Small-conductance mechanosensitive channel n=1 Tax=Luteimonas kalidii TaxID=3042025 RepID=A0ABT6JSA0_9GAMM|nr:mechanosensitive ion channel family protein [Luteimonas kalidii]MDH5833568.1 mechanosensitive ion channel family protein [Luteimonas kalidii]
MRADAAEANIQRVVDRAGRHRVTFRDNEQGTLVLLGNELVTLVTPDDLDILHGQTMAQARADIAQRLGTAVDASRQDRLPGNLVRGALWALGASLVMALSLALVLWFGARLRQRLRDRIARQTSRADSGALHHVMLTLRVIGDWLVRLLVVVAVLVVIEEWLRFVLGRFAFTRPWADAMTAWILGRLGEFGHAIAAAMPELVTAIVIFLIARLVARTVSVTFRGVQQGRFQLFGIDRELAEPTRKLAVAVVWLFAIAMAYPYLPGADTDAFKGLSVLVGLMVSLGASGIVGQAAGGFTIVYSRIMSVGDYVRSGEVEGTVQQLGLFATRLRTLTGVEVSIPNTVVLGSQLQNFSRNPDGPGVWLETGVTIGYDVPWRQVQRMLLDAAGNTDGIHPDPPPFVLQTALSDFYVEYLLRARIDDVLRRPLVLTQLHANIQDAFNGEGVQIMSPHYEADPQAPKLVPPQYREGMPPPGESPLVPSAAPG